MMRDASLAATGYQRHPIEREFAQNDKPVEGLSRSEGVLASSYSLDKAREYAERLAASEGAESSE